MSTVGGLKGSNIVLSYSMYLELIILGGFESYWEVKYGAKDAINGQWTKGPGMKLFNKLKEELGDMNIIAEDLGFFNRRRN